MEKLNIIDTRVWGIFHVVSLILFILIARCSQIELDNNCVR